MKTKVKGNARVLLTFLMIMTMVLTGSVMTSFAGNNGLMTVKNVEAGATVKAYQIVGKDAKGNWKALYGGIKDVTKPTAKEIGDLAKNPSKLGTPLPMNASGADYTATGEAGMYLVLVSKTKSTKVYNPMIIAVNYDKDAQLEGGSVDANTKFDNTAYAKSSTPGVTKEITGKTTNPQVTGDDSKYGDTLKPGDVTSFKIEATVPSYSAQYDSDSLKFEIADTVSDGLDEPTDIAVKDGAGPLKEGAGQDYTLVKSGKTFTVKLTKAYLLKGDSARTVTVTYKAKLNDQATSGFDANTNKAEITYSNNPKHEYEKKEKTTYHYTFDIDGNVMGSKGIKGEEIVKVGVDKTTGDLITKKESTGSSTETKALAKAEFTLYKADENGAKTSVVAGKATTDSKGLMNFSKLDAGKYVLVETKAPDGYVLNETEVPVEITAKLDPATGRLQSYSVKINNQITSTYTGNYDGGTEVKTVDKTGDTALFNNYKPGLLPSTGGMGTYLFMIAGGALIALAATLYVRNRKKQAM